MRRSGPKFPTVVVDLAGVTFLDSMTIGCLLWARNRCRSFGGDLLVVNPASEVAAVFEATGLTGFFADHLPFELADEVPAGGFDMSSPRRALVDDGTADRVALPPFCWGATEREARGGEPMQCHQFAKWFTEHTLSDGAALIIWSCDRHRDRRDWQPLP